METQINYIERLINATYLLDLQSDEIWKEFTTETKEQDSRYFVSNYGRVISLYKENPIVLKPFLCGCENSKYYCVSIGNKDYRINRLVAQAFIPNEENKPIVHHKDHNKLNNHYTNLEWTTHKENIDAYYKHIASQKT